MRDEESVDATLKKLQRDRHPLFRQVFAVSESMAGGLRLGSDIGEGLHLRTSVDVGLILYVGKSGKLRRDVLYSVGLCKNRWRKAAAK
jgi:hypothetical protein